MKHSITPLHLAAESRKDIEEALLRAHVLTRDADGYVESVHPYEYVFLGVQCYDTGKTQTSETEGMVQIFARHPGVWAAVFGPLSADQLLLLPLPSVQPAAPMVVM